MGSAGRYFLRPLPFLLFLLVCGDRASSAAPQLAASSPTCRDVRGSTSSSSCDFELDEETTDAIYSFLDPHFQETTDGGVDRPTFHVQGWRWHFMSLVRDSKRLERLAERLASNDEDGIGSEDLVGLERAADYVVNFNMAGLFRIQSDLSSKWLRDHLCDEDAVRTNIGDGGVDGDSDASAERHVAALRKLVDRLDEYRVRSEKAGMELYELAKKAASAPSSESQGQTKQLLSDVAKSSVEFSNQISSMRSLHESFIVPVVSLVVPSKTQKSFSNKVLLSLGILESRLHLVGMHDAVVESGVEEEEKKFGEEIPYVARAMIARWRKSLYVPRAGALDHGL